jgi:CBS domain containing-hemolysin-like protein
VILVLIAMSGLISATETALLALGPTGVHQILDEEHRHNRMLSQWRASPNRVIASILVANNVVNILASSLTTSLAAEILDGYGIVGAAGWSVAASVGVMTFLLILLGEVIPKTYAKHNARLLVPFFPLTGFICSLVRPIAWLFERISGGLIVAAGGSVGVAGSGITEEEIESMIRLGTAQGALPTDKQELLTSIIEFSDTMAKEILIPRTDVVGFERDEPLEEVLKVVGEHQYSRYPVYEEDLDTIIGILTVKDLMRYQAQHASEPFSLKKLASLRKTLFVPESKKIGELLREFQHEHSQMAVVVDEFGGTAGIVTIEDVLEEIVGEIYDEHDKAEPRIKESSRGCYTVPAKMAIEELADLFDVDLPDQELYETLGGLVITHAGRVPQKDETIEFEGLRFRVLERTRTRVVTLEVSRAGDQGGDGMSGAGSENG